jgi:hypothetical protein
MYASLAHERPDGLQSYSLFKSLYIIARNLVNVIILVLYKDPSHKMFYKTPVAILIKFHYLRRSAS